jgi:tetratricopeptide (TPR) repeat protein
MSDLPRPVKAVLGEVPDAAVVRTWARLQRTRRVGRPQRRAVLMCASGLALLAAGLLATLLRLRLERPPEVASAPVAVAEARLPSASAVLLRGRQGNAASQRGSSQPLHVVPPTSSQAPAPAPVADPVGTLLETASEAVRAGRFSRAAALLAEVGEHHQGDARACLALYALGRLQLDNLHQPAEAHQAFTRALELNPPEELVVPIWKSLEEADDPSVRGAK